MHYGKSDRDCNGNNAEWTAVKMEYVVPYLVTIPESTLDCDPRVYTALILKRQDDLPGRKRQFRRQDPYHSPGTADGIAFMHLQWRVFIPNITSILHWRTSSLNVTPSYPGVTSNRNITLL
ncbi:9441_t:CDS:2 [Ambispora gerdemannii]|uniref:9441_t:CDS:1 n=1 Tax=Ambispora gerdemannii TaxID=144530 RepID=A0A9N9AUY7_9GLOM|nr:9441_t:CDS:2 [Ambispora gerdemannii]